MGEAAIPLQPNRGRIENLVQWKPGQSGNPSGKNGITGLMAKLREASQDGDKLLAVLEDAIHHNNPLVRLRAVEIWFDRAYGKAFQPFVGDGQGKPMLDLTKLTQVEIETVIKLIAKSANAGPTNADPA